MDAKGANGEARHVVRTLRALELLTARSLSAPELAAELDVHVRTARRLLQRLADEGYVAGEARGRRYSATMKVVGLAGRVLDRTDLVRVAFPFVTRLRNQAREAAHLSVPTETAVMHLIQETGESIVMVKPRLGEQVPYHATAVGKALLAYLPEQWDRLRDRPLESFTERTIVDPADLLVELVVIRERGCAFDDQENSLDLRCVAAPVFDFSAKVVGSLGISAPVSRLMPEDFSRVGVVVIEVAGALSQALGFDGGSERDDVALSAPVEGEM